MNPVRRIGHALLCVYTYAMVLAASAVSIPFMTLGVALRLPFVSRRTFMRYFRRSIRTYGRIVISMPFPFVRVLYEYHTTPGDPGAPYIFVCNHRSASDAYLMCVLPNELIQIVNVWPFKIPVIGPFAKAAGYLSIKQMEHEDFIARCRELLAQGVSIVFFPEGTRSASRRMGSFHGAFARLAQISGAPIVPVCISGTEDKPLKSSLVLRPGVVRVRRLPAIVREEYKDLPVFALKNKVRERIQRELDVMEAAS